MMSSHVFLHKTNFLPVLFITPREKVNVFTLNLMYDRRSSYIFLGLAFVFLGTGSLFFFWLTNYLLHDPIENVQIKGRSYLKEEEILQLIQAKKGQRYTRTNLTKMRSILETHPIIFSADITQEGTDLLIDVQERQCSAFISEKKDGTIYDIDMDGRILSTGGKTYISRCNQVPLIRGDFQREGDYFRGKNLGHLIAVLSQIRENYPDLSEHLSEIRMNKQGGLTIFLTHSQLHIELPLEIETITIRRLYASIAYLFSEKIKRGWVDLRGPEAILYR